MTGSLTVYNPVDHVAERLRVAGAIADAITLERLASIDRRYPDLSFRQFCDGTYSLTYGEALLGAFTRIENEFPELTFHEFVNAASMAAKKIKRPRRANRHDRATKRQ